MPQQDRETEDLFIDDEEPQRPWAPIQIYTRKHALKAYKQIMTRYNTKMLHDGFDDNDICATCNMSPIGICIV